MHMQCLNVVGRRRWGCVVIALWWLECGVVNNESEHHNVVPTVVVVSLSVMLVRVCIFVMRMPCEKFSPSLANA